MTVRAVAFLPVAPGLVPAISRGASGDLDPVRGACGAALDRVLGLGLPVVIVGPEETAGGWGSARGFGVDLDWRIGPSEQRLPWAQAVGGWLLLDHRGRSAGPAAAGPCPAITATGPTIPTDDCVVLAMGDGSICRSTQAPGFLDDRAEAWDAAVARALEKGDLTGIDWQLGAELQAAGTEVWRALASLEGPWDAVLHADTAPQGVGLLVASWVRA